MPGLAAHPRIFKYIKLPERYTIHWMEWLIPEKNDVCEIHDLAEDEQQDLMRLAIGLGAWLKLRTEADKVNTAAIGNVVPQLHLHVVCRNRNDAVWPAPIWGNGEPAPLNETMLQGHITLIKAFLEETALR